MRTKDEVDAMIISLKGRQERLQQNYEDYIRDQATQLQGQSFINPMPISLLRGHDAVDSWMQEYRRIEAQLRVLYWVSGKFEIWAPL